VGLYLVLAMTVAASRPQPATAGNLCGDGVLDGGEECDPGGVTSVGGTPTGAPCTSGSNCFFVASGGCCKFNCQFVGQGNDCDDNNPCSIGEKCNNVGMCACTGSCNPSAGVGSVCRASTGECDPAEVCQADIGCPADVKEAAGTSCGDDGNPCTADQCNGTSALCQHPAGNAGAVCRPSTGECDPPETCTGSSTTCPAQNPPTGYACTDDGNPCTNDVCDANSTCTHPNNSAPCNDGLFCNGADTCSGGSCGMHTGNPCPSGAECNNSPTCSELTHCAVAAGTACSSDGNVCTDDRCDGSGACVHPDNTAPCNDGQPCNGADTCSGGTCSVHAGDPCANGAECNNTCNPDGTCHAAAGTPCGDDGNVCTNDQCNGNGSCEHPNNSVPCNDGLFCNGSDTCGGGSCSVHGGDPCAGGTECNNVCNEAARNCLVSAGTACTPDSNVCTDDVCNGTGACTHPNNTVSCEDGLFCTVGEQCSGGACSGGKPRDCSNPSSSICTIDSCDETNNTCVNTPDLSKNGSACDDHDACTNATRCSNGACSGGTALNCDDASACTVDSCDPASGCVHVTTVESCACQDCANGIDEDGDGDTDADDSDCSPLSDLQHFAVIGRAVNGKSVFLGSLVSIISASGTVSTSTAPFPLGPSRAGVCGEREDVISGVQIAGALAAASDQKVKFGSGEDVNIGRGYAAAPTTTTVLTGVPPVVGLGNCSDAGMAVCTQDAQCKAPATCEGMLLTPANPSVDTSGTQEEFVRCGRAKSAMAAEEEYIYGLPVSNVAYNLGALKYAPGDAQPIPSLSGPGPHILNMTKLRVAQGSVLMVTADDPNAVVVIQVDKTVSIAKKAHVAVGGMLKPQNLLWVVHGKGGAKINGSATFVGNILAPAGSVKLGQNVHLDGGLIANKVKINGSTSVTHLPFTPCL